MLLGSSFSLPKNVNPPPFCLPLRYYLWVPKSTRTDEGLQDSQKVSPYDISISVNTAAINSTPFLLYICEKTLSAFSLAIFLELLSSCFCNSSPHPTQIGVRSNFTLNRVKTCFIFSPSFAYYLNFLTAQILLNCHLNYLLVSLF